MSPSPTVQYAVAAPVFRMDLGLRTSNSIRETELLFSKVHVFTKKRHEKKLNI